MLTYNFAQSISNALDIPFHSISDQELEAVVKTADHQNVPAPHSPEIRKAISDACMGRIPYNKGIPNPEASERMKKNNPMFNPLLVRKMALSKTGKQAHNKILNMFEWNCKQCNKLHVDRDTIKKRKAANFCNKSCAASFSNSRRWCD
jgi:hypothetical protein